jgi:hypothetical protein
VLVVPFGEINPSELEDYYDGEISIAGKKIDVDLNFESEEIDKSILIGVDSLLKGVDKLAHKALMAVSSDWDLNEESETARFYLQHHLDEFDASEITAIFGTTDINKSTFINALLIERVGFYPEDDESYVIVDIQFNKDVTNYLMAVNFDNQGEITEITMES